MQNGLEEYISKNADKLQKYMKCKNLLDYRATIDERYSNEDIQLLTVQYANLLFYFDKHSNDEVMKYACENYPDIFSIKDLLGKEAPYYKFIWAFLRNNENKVDDIFNNCDYEYTKTDINIADNEYVIYVTNIKAENFNQDFCLEDTRNLQMIWGKPISELVKYMIQYGMSWIVSDGTRNNIRQMCKIHPINEISLKGDGWSNIGYREDLNNGFRSGWEANIARLLNYKGIKWEYEAENFKIEEPKYYQNKKSRTYIPDFALEDGTIIEVKGFWDNRSKLLVSQFMKQYPDKKYLVIDIDTYRCIYDKYKEVIKNWEGNKPEPTNDVIQVVGITISQRIPFVSKLKIGDKLSIEREPNNEYDSNAIKVTDIQGHHIGYFAMDCNSIYAPKMDSGFEYTIEIKSKEQKLLQCKITLSNPEKIIIPEIFK